MRRSTSMIAALLLAAGGALAQGAPAPANAQEAAFAASFYALDANKDGRLDPAEFLAGKRAEWAAYANGQAMTPQRCAQAASAALARGSALSDAEQKRVAERCARRDKNRDGALSWEEFAGAQWAFFKLLDVDKDGFVSLAEYADQGLHALRSTPRAAAARAARAAPDARMAGILANSKTRHQAPRTPGEVAAEFQASSAAAAAAAGQAVPAPGEPGAHAPAQAPAAGISDRIGNWLR